jgi:hypothetical protein
MIAIPAPRASELEYEPVLALTHPALRALLGRWRAHRGRRALPSEADLLFFNLKPWLGRVRRVAVVGGGRAFEPLPCANARIELPSAGLSAAYRQAAYGAAPVRALPAPGSEGLVLPFAGEQRDVSLLLVALYDDAALLS